MTSSVPGYTSKDYSGDGSSTAFSFQTIVEESGDIKVWLIEDGVETLQSLTTHYTLSGLGDAGGVTITFVTAPSATQTVRIARRTVPKQTVDYGDVTKVPGDTTEAQLDRLAMHGQDADTRLNDHEGRIEDIEDDLDAYDDLTDRFLGKYATDALATAAAGSPSEGQIYWNTTSKVFRYFDGSAWQAFPYATAADGAITFTKLDSTAYDWPKAFGAAEGNDAATNDAAFAALAVALGAREIDLGDGTYEVESIPSISARNGFFKIGNLLYPAQSLVQRTYMVTDGDDISHWAQDQAHTYRGVRYVGFGHGTGHGTADNLAKLTTSQDGGLTWETPTTEFSDATYAAWCASMGVLWGRQFAVVRYGGAAGVDVQDMKLFSRKLFEKFQLDSPFSTTSGSNQVQLTFDRNHGLMNGDVIDIVGAGTINGVTIASGEYTVSRANSLTVNIDGSGSASETGSGLGPSDVGVKTKQGAWTERTFPEGSLGDAIVVATGAADYPVVVQSFAGFANDRALVCVSGNGQFGILRINTIYNTSASVSYFPFSTSSGRTESTVCVSGSYAYGMMRTQSDTLPPVFWWATSLTGSITITETEFPFHFAQANPIPVRYHASTDVLYAVTAERLTEAQDVTKLPVYLLAANAADARSNGADAFRVAKLGEIKATMNGGFGSGTAFQTGVPSLDVDEDTLIAYISEEQNRLSGGIDKYCCNIKAFEFDVSTPVVA